MMGHIVVVEPFVAFIAEIGSVEEAAIGVAPIVALALFDETNDLVGGYESSVDDHMRWVDGPGFDLVPGQGGLKLFEFRDTARPLGVSRKLVKFLAFRSWAGYSGKLRPGPKSVLQK